MLVSYCNYRLSETHCLPQWLREEKGSLQAVCILKLIYTQAKTKVWTTHSAERGVFYLSALHVHSPQGTNPLGMVTGRPSFPGKTSVFVGLSLHMPLLLTVKSQKMEIKKYSIKHRSTQMCITRVGCRDLFRPFGGMWSISANLFIHLHFMKLFSQALHT